MDTRPDKKGEKEYKGNLTNQPPGAIPPESLVGQDDGQPHPTGAWTKLRHRAEETAESIFDDARGVTGAIRKEFDTMDASLEDNT